MTTRASLDDLSRAMNVVRFCVLGSLVLYLAIVQLVAHAGIEGRPPWTGRALFAGVLTLAAGIIVMRSFAGRTQIDARTRLRWWIACYAACDALGVAGLLVWVFEGDVRQATGAILAAGIFAAGGGRVSTDRAGPQ